MPLSRTFAVFVTAALSALAQPPGAGTPSVTASHVHLNSAHPDVAVTFWNDMLGTTSSTVGSFKGVSTLGVRILFTEKAPTGPSAGSAIDHIAFKVPDLQPVIDRLAKTPYKSFRPPETMDRLMIDGPDGVRIELTEDSSMYAPLEFDHIYLAAKQIAETQAWYAKALGARGGFGDNPNAIFLPGASLSILKTDAPAPSAGRAIDHISFEVKDLEGLCKKLAEAGVKMDAPPHAEPQLGASVALLHDPSGAEIELMEKAAH